MSFLNELELMCLHTSIAIVSTQLNDYNLLWKFAMKYLEFYSIIIIYLQTGSGYKYCYLTLIILFTITHSFAHS